MQIKAQQIALEDSPHARQNAAVLADRVQHRFIYISNTGNKTVALQVPGTVTSSGASYRVIFLAAWSVSVARILVNQNLGQCEAKRLNSAQLEDLSMTHLLPSSYSIRNLVEMPARDRSRGNIVR